MAISSLAHSSNPLQANIATNSKCTGREKTSDCAGRKAGREDGVSGRRDWVGGGAGWEEGLGGRRSWVGIRVGW